MTTTRGSTVIRVGEPGEPRPHHLLSVSTSRHTKNVMRITSALPVNVTAHC
jgi:hypothetical protein